ncbi:thiamine diphosphokinase [Aureimonas flava]|uniref:Thiamine diphosphokinase n=1 Tax=Aureimonas flava TaxID=2320271 RepID=A0A3A1WI99_9HYPH|nr:thiamine diphosphokinase [Aureimonas flava]RIY00314.1 thiamine diphosphokinase [Aureimonas flava]
MSRFTILLAGPILVTPRLLEEVRGSRTIAADAGLAHAAPLGLVPELWVGDFDSHSPAVAEGAPPRLEYPRDKDRTDGEIAIQEAFARGASSVLLVGAFGGRTDHVFSHLVVALRESEAGRPVTLFDGREWGFPLARGPQSFAAEAGMQFSVLKFSDLEALTITGARFPLYRADIPFTSILTQSNEATGGEIAIDLAEGRAMLLLQADPERR